MLATMKGGKSWEWWHVAIAVSATAIAILFGWAAFVVLWNHGAPAGYTEVGTFGDSFAPIVGALNAFAIGGALASVFLQRSELQLQREEMKQQREEMEEARKQYTAQAEALADANRLAHEANKLAHTGQLIEVWRQTAELERAAVAIVEAAANVQLASRQAHPGMEAQFGIPIGDPRFAWHVYWGGDPADRTKARFDSHQMRLYADVRLRLHQAEEIIISTASPRGST